MTVCGVVAVQVGCKKLHDTPAAQVLYEVGPTCAVATMNRRVQMHQSRIMIAAWPRH